MRQNKNTVDNFVKLRSPVQVNGSTYNRVMYTPESGVVMLVIEKNGVVVALFDTTFEELSTQYGLRTAVRVRTALLKIYGDELVAQIKSKPVNR
jgi:hypothetical protein